MERNRQCPEDYGYRNTRRDHDEDEADSMREEIEEENNWNEQHPEDEQ